MKNTTTGARGGALKSSKRLGTLMMVMVMFAGVIFGQGGLSTAYAQPTPPVVTATMTGPDTANIGDNVTYTVSLQVANTPLPMVSVNYYVPFGMDFVSASQVSGPGSFSCVNNSNLVTCSATTTFPTGQVATINFVNHINTYAGAGRYFYNEAQITGSYGVNQYTEGVTTHIPSNTAVSIEGPSRILPGKTVTYQVVVKNSGAYPVGFVSLFYAVPTSLTYLSSDSEDCSLESGGPTLRNTGLPSQAGIYCQMGAFSAGETKTVSLTFQANGNLGECFDNAAMITIFGGVAFKGEGVNQGTMAGETDQTTFTTCYGENNTPEPPADLVAQLRVSPDRVATGSDNTDITYSLTVKNVGYGKAHQVQVTFPFDPSLVVGYATFGEEGAWVSEIGSDKANPYVKINLPDLDNNAEATATLVLRPSGTAASGASEFNRFTVKWNDAVLTGKMAGSNAVKFRMGDANINLNNGEVQLFDPAEITIPNGQTQTITGNFFAPGELVSGWYTDPNGQSVSLGSKQADANGMVSFDFTASGMTAGGKYILAAYGNRSGISGSSVITIGS